MAEKVALPGWKPAAQSIVNIKVEVTASVNISAYVARQRANRFLILQVGDQFCAGEPELVIGDVFHWRVPVQYAPSRCGILGIVGHLLVNAETGDSMIADEHTAEDLIASAEALYERTTSSARA